LNPERARSFATLPRHRHGIPNSSHAVVVEQPDAVAEALISYARRL